MVSYLCLSHTFNWRILVVSETARYKRDEFIWQGVTIQDVAWKRNQIFVLSVLCSKLRGPRSVPQAGMGGPPLYLQPVSVPFPSHWSAGLRLTKPTMCNSRTQPSPAKPLGTPQVQGIPGWILCLEKHLGNQECSAKAVQHGSRDGLWYSSHTTFFLSDTWHTLPVHTSAGGSLRASSSPAALGAGAHSRVTELEMFP